MYLANTLLAAALWAHSAQAGYSLADDYSHNFFDMFDFFTGQDPTHGFVNYVDQTTAQSHGLINNNTGGYYIGVDHTNQAPQGRNSVRLSSKKAYTTMLVVLDIANMPYGCGTWPAFWSFGPNWPQSGEIDIIEGVNDGTTNKMTLHSGSDCSIQGKSKAALQPASTNCDALSNNNQGCGFQDTDSSFYGAGLNKAGGAVYAMEWTTSGISVWRWHRSSMPSDALGANPNPSAWGTPAANWAAGCDYASKFTQNNLVFDNTFCGDWAGNAFQSCSAAHGGQSCENFVANNPSAFQNAFWYVNALKVYQTDGNNTPSNTAPATSSAAPAAAATAVNSASAQQQQQQQQQNQQQRQGGPTSGNNGQNSGPLQSNDFGSSSQGIAAPDSANTPATNNKANAAAAAPAAAAASSPAAAPAPAAVAAAAASSPSPSPAAPDPSSSGELLQANEFGSGSHGIPARRRDIMPNASEADEAVILGRNADEDSILARSADEDSILARNADSSINAQSALAALDTAELQAELARRHEAHLRRHVRDLRVPKS